MKALTIFPDAGLNRPLYWWILLREKSVFTVSRAGINSMQRTATRLNHFILLLEKIKAHICGSRGAAAHDPCNLNPFTQPLTDCSHTASSSGDCDFSNLTSLLAIGKEDSSTANQHKVAHSFRNILRKKHNPSPFHSAEHVWKEQVASALKTGVPFLVFKSAAVL